MEACRNKNRKPLCKSIIQLGLIASKMLLNKASLSMEVPEGQMIIKTNTIQKFLASTLVLLPDAS